MFTPKKSDVCEFPGVKSPFPAENPCKSPPAVNLRYFGACPVVVASEGLLEALTTPAGPCRIAQWRVAEKIAHCISTVHEQPLPRCSTRGGRSPIHRSPLRQHRAVISFFRLNFCGYDGQCLNLHVWKSLPSPVLRHDAAGSGCPVIEIQTQRYENDTS